VFGDKTPSGSLERYVAVERIEVMKCENNLSEKNDGGAPQLAWISPALEELLQSDEFSALRQTMSIYAAVLDERSV
jgi:hypothetical protein